MIDVRSLTFTYPGSRVPAIERASLHIDAGEFALVIGASGAGKTTVFKLLLRFYDPDSGLIRLDGTPIAEAALADVRERIGIVLQSSGIDRQLTVAESRRMLRDTDCPVPQDMVSKLEHACQACARGVQRVHVSGSMAMACTMRPWASRGPSRV